MKKNLISIISLLVCLSLLVSCSSDVIDKQGTTNTQTPKKDKSCSFEYDKILLDDLSDVESMSESEKKSLECFVESIEQCKNDKINIDIKDKNIKRLDAYIEVFGGVKKSDPGDKEYCKVILFYDWDAEYESDKSNETQLVVLDSIEGISKEPNKLLKARDLLLFITEYEGINLTVEDLILKNIEILKEGYEQLPEKCTIGPGLVCVDFNAMTDDSKISNGDAKDKIVILLNNALGNTIHSVKIKADKCSNEGVSNTIEKLNNIESGKFEIHCAGLTPNENFKSNLTITYVTKIEDMNISHVKNGYISTKVYKI